MVKMVESAEEFKALKMGDKPVRASPPRALPGSFSSGCQLGRQGFFSARPPAGPVRVVHLRENPPRRPPPRDHRSPDPSRALSRPRDPPANPRIAPRTRDIF